MPPLYCSQISSIYLPPAFTRGVPRQGRGEKNHILPNSPSHGFRRASRLRAARSAALTAHRAVIHSRRLRFAYPLESGGRGCGANYREIATSGFALLAMTGIFVGAGKLKCPPAYCYLIFRVPFLLNMQKSRCPSGHLLFWYTGRDSNPQPSEPESDALSIEPPVHTINLVIIARFSSFVKGKLKICFRHLLTEKTVVFNGRIWYNR